MERLIAIYEVIAKDANMVDSISNSSRKIPDSIYRPCQSVFMSLSTLCEYRLLDCIGSDAIDSSYLKYRCNITEKTAESVARDLNIMLQQFIRYA